MRKILAFISSGLAASLWTGCAGTSVFKSYPERINPVIDMVRSGDDAGALTMITGTDGENLAGRDKQLYLLEAGRIAFLAGDTNATQGVFGAAIQSIELEDEEAVVQASKAGEQLSALLLNDNSIPYSARGYESIYAYQYQAMSYLLQGDLSAAGIEARNALGAQRAAQLRQERKVSEAQSKYERASEKAKVAGLDLDSMLASAESKVSASYSGIDEIAGEIRSAYENAINHFLSAMIFELQGDVDTALPSFRDALELVPKNSSFQSTVYRYSDGGDRKDLTAEYGDRLVEMNRQDGLAPEIFIQYDESFIDQKEQVKIPFPVGISQASAIAFPTYKPSKILPASPIAFIDDNEASALELAVDCNRLAYRAFKDELPLVILRAVVRTTLKSIAAREANNRLGALGGLAMSAYNIVSENADVRGWYTLPARSYVMRRYIPEGSKEVTITGSSGGKVTLPLVADAAAMNIIYIADLNGRMVAQSAVVNKPSVLSSRATPAPAQVKYEDSAVVEGAASSTETPGDVDMSMPPPADIETDDNLDYADAGEQMSVDSETTAFEEGIVE